MARIVQKFGGTSVGSVERIIRVADRVIAEADAGHEVIVVVSAMGKTTDQLVTLANELTVSPSAREMDMLLSTGEQVTTSLLAMALQNRGMSAASITGWQAGIQTESVPGNARIVNIDTTRLEQLLASGTIAIVAGFQGISQEQDITTLGRGGSDTTAVALAAALHADRCDIYTDVPGVFTTDPRVVKDARKLQRISYDEMLELAHLGAGVLHPRAVEFAKNYQIPLTVRSSMTFEEGTRIEEEVKMENRSVVRGIAFEDQITRMTLFRMPRKEKNLSAVFSTLARHRINVDIIIQSVTSENSSNLSFSVKDSDVEEASRILEQEQERLHFEKMEAESGLAKVSIVGSGMISNPGVAAEMFDKLAQEDIDIKMVSTSEIKVSTVIEKQHMQKATQALHNCFHLGEEMPVEGVPVTHT